MDRDPFRIFISHKHADASVAKAVKDQLERLVTGRVSAFVSGEDLVAGSDWRRRIKQQLADSHLLLLLYTRPSHRWDWCLYETGLFTRFEKEAVSSVVCLYDPNGETPAPLSNLQGVPVTPKSVATFLRTLCRDTLAVADTWRRGDLAPRLGDDRIEAVAARICRAFEKAIGDVYHPCHRVVLDLRRSEARNWDRIPDDAIVSEGLPDTSSYTMSLFGSAVGSKRLTWADLLRAKGDQDADWRHELDASFAHAVEERLSVPGTSTMKAWDRRADESRCYLPVLYQLERNGGSYEPRRVVVVFTPVAS